MFRMGLLLCLWTSLAWAQYNYTIPDLKGEHGESVYLGLVNVEQADAEMILRGYAADGESLVEFKTQLGKFARLEGTAADLFGNDEVVWASVESSGKLAGYMRYADATGHMSLAPMVEWTGDSLFVAQPDAFKELPVRTTLVNAAQTDGEVFYQPFLTNKRGEQERAADPIALADFGSAGGQTTFSYSAASVKDDAEALVWDQLFGTNVSLAGVHRFGANAANQPKAAVVPSHTSYRSMVIPGGMPGKTGVVTVDTLDHSLVLINTHAGSMHVQIEAFYDASKYHTIRRPQDYEPVVVDLDMGPFEKLVYDLDQEDNLTFSRRPAWYRITPFEGGLVGFMTVRDESTGAVAAVEGNPLAGNVSNLPYTPSNQNVSTRITTINTSDQVIHANWVGFDDQGRIRGFKGLRCEPHTRYVATTEELFGAAASQISWTRVYTQTFELAAFAEVSERGGQDLAMLGGQVSDFGRGELAFATWEYFSTEEFFNHGWLDYYLPTETPRYLLEYEDNKPSQARLLNHPQYAYPSPGNFFIDNACLPAEGYFSVGYEPIFIERYGLRERVPDRVALLSPYLQVPQIDDLNIRFQMRMTDPERATKGSRYGIMIQEEGTSDFYWFGLLGEVLQDPPLVIGDCWEEVRYRNEMVTLTPWWQFEGQLPERFKGKRIRIGLYYDHDTTIGPEQPGPRLFMDNVRITADQLSNGIFYPLCSGYDEGHFPIE